MDSQASTTHVVRVPPVIHSGEQTYQQVAAEARRLGTRVLVVTDRVVAALRETQEIVAAMHALGVPADVFDDVPGEPTTREVDAGLARLRESAADVVVAIGGGSVIDTAKAIAAMARHDGRVADYVGAGKLRNGRLSLVAAATTAGTGSEVTRFAVITDPETSVKMLISDPALIPDVAVADPLLTLSCPPRVTAATGLDALIHAIEAYVSRRATPTSDLFALAAIGLIARGIEPAWRDGQDRPARAAMMRGALYAGLAFSNASVALVHGMSRPVGAYFHVAHGISNAMLLAAVMRYSLDAAEARYAEIGRQLTGDPAATARDALAFVEQLTRALGIPRLSAGGVDPKRLRELAPRMARDAIASGSPGNNPRVPTEEEIVELYLECL
ncbi:MAG: iron-containing alcohol dehydrogenase [Chloroflexi bacterium]|nr:iron-containing alcohol dehydrogenase [Chloroflexota bacterium]